MRTFSLSDAYDLQWLTPASELGYAIRLDVHLGEGVFIQPCALTPEELERLAAEIRKSKAARKESQDEPRPSFNPGADDSRQTRVR